MKWLKLNNVIIKSEPGAYTVSWFKPGNVYYLYHDKVNLGEFKTPACAKAAAEKHYQKNEAGA